MLRYRGTALSRACVCSGRITNARGKHLTINFVHCSVVSSKFNVLLIFMQARRDVVRIFRYFLERQTDNTIKYIIKNQALISNLISGYVIKLQLLRINN